MDFNGKRIWIVGAMLLVPLVPAAVVLPLVLDVARLVHKEIAESLKFARVWGSGQFDGQQVGADHPMADEDIVEFHG